MTKELKRPATVLTYSKIQPKLSKFSSTDILEFKNEITLSSKSEAVEIDNNVDFLSGILTISSLYSYVPELCLKISDHEQVLIFSHVESGAHIRPKSVNTEIWDEICKVRDFSFKKSSKGKLIIDLEPIWDKTKPDNNLVKNTKTFINNLAEKLEYAEEINFSGEIPLLPLLTAIYLARPLGRKVIFSDKKIGSLIIFK